MGRVFINYRSTDNPLAAAGIHDALANQFGDDRVFRDCVSLLAGHHYPTEIRAALEDALVLIAIIGPQWLVLTDDTGDRLIDRPQDWVRLELAWAFSHQVPVVPVLLKDTPGHATHPHPAELPDDIKPLATIQSFPFSQLRFRPDLDRLAARLTQLAPILTVPSRGTNGHSNGSPTPTLTTAALAELATALEAVPSMRHQDTRSFIVSRLNPMISGGIRHFNHTRAHLISILETCLEYDNGLPELIALIQIYEGTESISFQRFLTVAHRTLPNVTDRGIPLAARTTHDM